MTMAAAAGAMTGPMSPGSIDRPKAKKNSAANASRRGSTSRWMRRAAAVPASTRPAMKAPIASDTPSSYAIPATSSAKPTNRTTRSSSSFEVMMAPTTRVP